MGARIQRVGASKWRVVKCTLDRGATQGSYQLGQVPKKKKKKPFPPLSLARLLRSSPEYSEVCEILPNRLPTQPHTPLAKPPG